MINRCEDNASTEIFGTRIAGRKARQQQHADLFGYNNTKSAGWEPTRDTTREQQMEDYADEEDLRTMMKSQLFQKEGYEKSGNKTAQPGLIKPCSDFIGARLLRKMGWFPGFGIGTNETRKKKKIRETDSNSDGDIQLPPEPKIDTFLEKQQSRSEFSGPGYIPPRLTAQVKKQDEDHGRSYMGSKLQKLSSTTCDSDEEDDPYTHEDMSMYDEAFTNPTEYKKNLSATSDVSRQHTQALLRGFDPRDIKMSDAQFKNWPIQFIAAASDTLLKKTSKAVDVPQGWTPNPRSILQTGMEGPQSIGSSSYFSTSQPPTLDKNYGSFYDVPTPIRSDYQKVNSKPTAAITEPPRKLSGALGIRFATGQKQGLQASNDPMFSGGLVTSEELQNITEGGTRSKKQSEPNIVKSQKRLVRDWYPNPLLCKRFSVEDPHPEVAEKGDYVPNKGRGTTLRGITIATATSAAAFAEALDNDKARKAADKNAAKQQRRAERKFSDFQNLIGEHRKTTLDVSPLSSTRDLNKQEVMNTSVPSIAYPHQPLSNIHDDSSLEGLNDNNKRDLLLKTTDSENIKVFHETDQTATTTTVTDKDVVDEVGQPNQRSELAIREHLLLTRLKEESIKSEVKQRLLSLRLEKERNILNEKTTSEKITSGNNQNSEYVANTVMGIMEQFRDSTDHEVTSTVKEEHSQKSSIAAAIFTTSDDDDDVDNAISNQQKSISTDVVATNISDNSIKHLPPSKSSIAAAIFDSDDDDTTETPITITNIKSEASVKSPSPKGSAAAAIFDSDEETKPTKKPITTNPLSDSRSNIIADHQPQKSVGKSVLENRPSMSIFRSIFAVESPASSDDEESDEKDTKKGLIFSNKPTTDNPSELKKDNAIIRDRIARLREICDSSSDSSSSSSTEDTATRRRKKKVLKKAKKKEKKKAKKDKKRLKKAKKKEKRKAKKQKRKDKKRKRDDTSSDDSSTEEGAI